MVRDEVINTHVWDRRISACASVVFAVKIQSIHSSIVCLSHACFLTNERTCRYFDTIWKDIPSSFPTLTAFGRQRPLTPKIVLIMTLPLQKCRLIASAIRASAKSSLSLRGNRLRHLVHIGCALSYRSIMATWDVSCHSHLRCANNHHCELPWTMRMIGKCCFHCPRTVDFQFCMVCLLLWLIDCSERVDIIKETAQVDQAVITVTMRLSLLLISAVYWLNRSGLNVSGPKTGPFVHVLLLVSQSVSQHLTLTCRKVQKLPGHGTKKKQALSHMKVQIVI